MTTSAVRSTDHDPALAGRGYGAAAMILHWLIALAIIGQVCLGWYMNEALPDEAPQRHLLVGIHISVGVTILLLVLARIVVRLVNPPPPLPAGMPSWERVLAQLSHLGFYLLMLALPLTGWMIVSLGGHPIHVWGAPWPKLPGLGFLGSPPSHETREKLSHVHVFILIWILVVMLALHLAAVIKHQFDGSPVLWRMLPARRSSPRR